MKKTVVLTTVFPVARPYLGSFFDSLQSQSRLDFDILVLNDGIDDLGKITSSYSNLDIAQLKVSSSPQVNRVIGIKEVIRREYEFIVFADSDDYFDVNRIEVVTSLLREWDIVVNELVLVNDDKQILNHGAISKRFLSGSKIESLDILEKNIFGFSNTAARVKCFNNIPFPEDIIALDWYIFSYMLNLGSSAVFTNSTKSYYRQYSGNMIGLGSEPDENSILLGIETKEKQFSSLATVDSYYKRILPAYQELGKRIRQDSEYRSKYLEFIRHCHNPNSLWWEEIILDVNF